MVSDLEKKAAIAWRVELRRCAVASLAADQEVHNAERELEVAAAVENNAAASGDQEALEKACEAYIDCETSLAAARVKAQDAQRKLDAARKML